MMSRLIRSPASNCAKSQSAADSSTDGVSSRAFGGATLPNAADCSTDSVSSRMPIVRWKLCVSARSADALACVARYHCNDDQPASTTKIRITL